MNNKILCMCITLAAACAGASAQEGMTVVRDPVTGKLRAPTAAELRDLRRQNPQPQMTPAKPQSTLRADGTRKLQLGERGMVYSVVTRSADGKLKHECVHADDADGALQKQEESQHEHP